MLRRVGPALLLAALVGGGVRAHASASASGPGSAARPAAPTTTAPVANVAAAEPAAVAAPAPAASASAGTPAQPAPAAPPPGRVLLMGDSIAHSVGQPLGAVARGHGIYLHSAAVSGCSLIEGVTTTEDGRLFPWSTGCAGGIARYELDMVAAHRPDVVVWMSAWESVDRFFDDGARVRPGTALGNARLLAEIDKAVGRLRSGGARVVFVLLAPPPEGSIDAAEHTAVARLPYLNALLREYARQHADAVFVADMAPILCPAGPPCPHEMGGLVPRPDGVHFDDPTGAQWVAEQLFPMLLAPVIPGLPPASATVGVGRT